MRRLFFQKPNATVITAIMTGQTPESLIGQSRGAEFDGADAIAVDLCDLRPEFRNRESLERVINAVNLPFMFYFYRNDRHKIANDEKLVPREWVTEDGSYVTDEFVNYVRPLIQGDVSPVMVDGIPRHLYRQL